MKIVKKNAFVTLATAQFFYVYGNSRVPFRMRQSICCTQGPNGVFLKKILDRDSEAREISVIKFIGPVEVLTEWVTRLDEFDNESADAFLDVIWARKAQADYEFELSARELPDLNVGGNGDGSC